MAVFLMNAQGDGGWFVADESVGLLGCVIRFEARVAEETEPLDYEPPLLETGAGFDGLSEIVSRSMLQGWLRQRRRLFDATVEAFGRDEAERFFRSDG